MQEKKYILNVGLNDKDAKIQKITTLEAYKMAENILLNNGLDGFTIYEGRGLYKHDSGAVVYEKTLIIEIIGSNDKIINNIIQLLKVALNQESILKQVQKITLSFE